MKFTSAIAAAILGAASTLAVPVPSQPSTANTLFPTFTSQYNVWSGAVTYNVNTGLVRKDGPHPDITTLVTFNVPTTLTGRKCKFVFTLDPASTVTGSGQFDVFSSIAPATHSTTDWPNGNLRDQYLGRFQAKIGDATPIDINNDPFDCPAGETLAGELVGVNDVDHIEWNVNTPGTGPKIIVLP